jgi:hypothetical protein
MNFKSSFQNIIYCGDIRKNVYKGIPLVLLQFIYPSQTLNFKKNDKNLVFSTKTVTKVFINSYCQRKNASGVLQNTGSFNATMSQSVTFI